MSVRGILLLGDPTLRLPCKPVKDFTSQELRNIVEDLQDTLLNFRSKHGFGRGIAAPQIGVSKRVIFMYLNEPQSLANPEIIEQSSEIMTLWDDCFSFPDILVKVKRSVKISLEYQDMEGKRNTISAIGDHAALLQHEIDHLDGILAIDRAVDSKHIILRSEWIKLNYLTRTNHPLYIM